MVLTTLAVVWSGLATLWSGKAFGTPTDYLATFLWGVIAQVAVAAVALVLGRLARAPLAARAQTSPS